MSTLISVVSGKGGVGKTVASLNLGVGLTRLGRDVTLVDGNLTTPNIGLHLGQPKNPVSLHDVLNGHRHVSEATYLHASGLKIVPSHIALHHSRSPNHQRLGEIFDYLSNKSEFIIVDTPPGLGSETEGVIRHSRNIIGITTPDLVSVTDTLKTLRLCEHHGKHVLGCIVNRFRKSDDLLTVQNIHALIQKPIIGVVRESDAVYASLRQRHPLLHIYPALDVSKDFMAVAAKIDRGFP